MSSSPDHSALISFLYAWHRVGDGCHLASFSFNFFDICISLILILIYIQAYTSNEGVPFHWVHDKLCTIRFNGKGKESADLGPSPVEGICISRSFICNRLSSPLSALLRRSSSEDDPRESSKTEFMRTCSFVRDEEA
mmetsp:Transcript_8185/g.16526  ORF Transcript_8185/g.16526 Transcript_8185/m.16526 type:complete len:137 (-) Transcript_8185:1282-1692(-)